MTTTTVYLIHGDDALTIDETVAELRAKMGDDPNAELNTSDFAGDATSVDEVLNAVSSYPFLSDRRIAFVRGLVGHLTRKGAGNVGKKELEKLIEGLPHLPDYARLILIERSTLPKNNAILKFADQHAGAWVRECPLPQDSSQWISQRARHYGARIDQRASMALASVTGGDLYRADNELAKLVAYVDDERPITEDDVALLTPYVAEVNVFNMIDALAVGNGQQALALVNTILEQDPSDNGIRLFALIVRQFRLLLLTREHLETGGGRTGNAIAQAIGVRSAWQAEKLAKQSRAFTVTQLEQIFRRLQRYDEDMKTGKIAPRLALDLLIASLSKK